MATKDELDEFEIQVGLPPNLLPGEQDEFKTYLNMPIAALEKLSDKDCANIGYRITQFGLYIQRYGNMKKAEAKRIIHEIDKIVCPVMHQYSGNWTSQKIAAIQDNDVARKLSEELLDCEQKIQRFEEVSKRISELANSMKNIQFTKREQNAQSR